MNDTNLQMLIYLSFRPFPHVPASPYQDKKKPSKETNITKLTCSHIEYFLPSFRSFCLSEWLIRPFLPMSLWTKLQTCLRFFFIIIWSQQLIAGPVHSLVVAASWILVGPGSTSGALQKQTHTHMHTCTVEVSSIMEVLDELKWVHSGTQGQLFACPPWPPNWAPCLNVPC